MLTSIEDHKGDVIGYNFNGVIRPAKVYNWTALANEEWDHMKTGQKVTSITYEGKPVAFEIAGTRYDSVVNPPPGPARAPEKAKTKASTEFPKTAAEEMAYIQAHVVKPGGSIERINDLDKNAIAYKVDGVIRPAMAYQTLSIESTMSILKQLIEYIRMLPQLLPIKVKSWLTNGVERNIQQLPVQCQRLRQSKNGQIHILLKRVELRNQLFGGWSLVESRV